MKLYRVVLAFVAILAVAVSGLVVSGPALAAKGAGFDPDSIVLTRVPEGDPNQPLKVGDTVRIEADWSVPDRTPSGYKFSMELPDVFSLTSIATFPLVDADGETAGTCTPVPGPPAMLNCTLNDYASTRENVSGSAWVEVRASKVTEDSSVGFTVDGETVYVKLPPDGGGIIEEGSSGGEGGGGGSTPTPPEELKKYGNSYLNEGGGFWWNIVIPRSFMTSGADPITVSDRVGDGAPHRFTQVPYPNNGRPYVEQMCDEDPYPRPIGEGSDLYSYDVASDGLSSSWTLSAALAEPLKEGVSGQCGVRINYRSDPVGDVEPGAIFRNNAEVEGTIVSSWVKVSGSGGGNAGGDQSGRFTVKKSVAGEGASVVPAGTEFTVKWSAPGYPGGDLMVPADGSVVSSPSFAAGTKVTIEEVNLPPVSGVDWGVPSVVVDGVSQGEKATVTIGANKTVAVEVVNTANAAPPETGDLVVSKVVSGEGASLVPDGTPFVVGYSYTVPGGSPVSGELTVVKGGSPVEVSDVPDGTEVTVREVRLPEVAGVVWGEPSIVADGVPQSVPAVLTVTTGSDIRVVVTNDAQEAPPVVGSVSWSKGAAEDPGVLLPGSAWAIYRVGDVPGEDDPVKTVVDNEVPGDLDPVVGQLRVGDLAPGEYFVVETRAPAGYELNSVHFPFTVPAGGGDVSLVGTVGSTVTDIKEPDPVGSVSWGKGNADNPAQLLPGSSWEIYAVGDDPARDEPVVRVTDNQDPDLDPTVGRLKVGALPVGEYFLIESRSPAGYQLNTQQYPFTITGGQDVTLPGVDDGVVLNVPDPVGTIAWNKTAGPGATGLRLPGSEWAIYASTDDPGVDEPVQVVVDNGIGDLDPAAGQLKAGNLDPGRYFLIETKAPEGYELNLERFPFVIGPDGGDVVLSGTHGSDVADEKTPPPVGGVSWSKVAAGSGELLPGSVWAVFDSGADPAVDEPLMTVTDNGSGDLDPAVGRLKVGDLPPGSYLLVERVAPEGYELNPTVFTFTVPAVGGDVELDGVDGSAVADEETPLGSISWGKVDSEAPGLGLPGSGWAIYRAGDDPGRDEPVREVSDNGEGDENPADGLLTVGGLEAGITS